MKSKSLFKYSSIAIVSLWLSLFALTAFAIVLVVSFLKQDAAGFSLQQLTLHNYRALFDPIFLTILGRSLIIASLATLLCLAIAYPFAYLLSHLPSQQKPMFLMLLIIPFWTSSLIRSYAMLAMLKTHGVLNSLLLWLGIINQPLQILFTNTALMIGLVYNLLPFMILPIFANLERLDFRLIEAAKDLGATSLTIFWHILLPLTIPGIMGGVLLVFFPAMTLFYIPDLLGGAKSILLGNLIQLQFLAGFNWPQGAATSIMLTLVMGLMLAVYWLLLKKHGQKELL